MVIMVDPGVTSNCISWEAVKILGIPVTSFKEFEVSLRTRDVVQQVGICKSLVLEELSIQWLEKLGTMTTN